MGEDLSLGVVQAVGVDTGALRLQVTVRGVPGRLAPENHHLWPRGAGRELAEEGPLVEPAYPLGGEEDFAFWTKSAFDKG